MLRESVSSVENVFPSLFASITHLISSCVQHSFRSDTVNSSQSLQSLRYSFLNSYSCSDMSRNSLLRAQARRTGSGPLRTFYRKEAAINTGLASARYSFKRCTVLWSFSLETSVNSVDIRIVLGSSMVNPCSRKSLTI